MGDSADIVIVGAGIIGLCTALQLARRTDAKILVLEKGVGPGEGSTGASSAVCRFKYTRPETVNLARDGIAAYQNWSEFVGLKAPLAQFHRHGVLWFADGRTDWPAQEVARLASHGIRAAVLDDTQLKERFPALNPCAIPPDLEGGEDHACGAGGLHLLEVDGGYMDPVDALQDLLTALREVGVEVRFRAHVAGIETHGGAVLGVTLASSERIACGQIVNAAGPWCNDLFSYVGLDCPWPLKPTRIQIVHVDRPAEVVGDIPVAVDPLSGIYFRSQSRGQEIIVGSILEEDEREAIERPDDYARFVEDDFAQTKLHALQHKIPALSIRGKVRGYSGLYTINATDVHPVVGKTAVRGFYVANGCSGHGFKLAPAIGSLIAQEIAGKGGAFDTDVSPAFLAFDRPPIAVTSKSVLA
jgi:glycine/D-amino acid oxidase-like deaminating enzyme